METEVAGSKKDNLIMMENNRKIIRMTFLNLPNIIIKVNNEMQDERKIFIRVRLDKI